MNTARLALANYLHLHWGCRAGSTASDHAAEYEETVDRLINAVADHLHTERGCRLSCRSGLAGDGNPAHRAAWVPEAERILSQT